jgi:hypothetical protein
MTLFATRERFVAIGADAIATGFAALTSHQTARELIADADGDALAASPTVRTTAHRPSPT